VARVIEELAKFAPPSKRTLENVTQQPMLPVLSEEVYGLTRSSVAAVERSDTTLVPPQTCVRLPEHEVEHDVAVVVGRTLPHIHVSGVSTAMIQSRLPSLLPETPAKAKLLPLHQKTQVLRVMKLLVYLTPFRVDTSAIQVGITDAPVAAEEEADAGDTVEGTAGDIVRDAVIEPLLVRDDERRRLALETAFDADTIAVLDLIFDVAL